MPRNQKLFINLVNKGLHILLKIFFKIFFLSTDISDKKIQETFDLYKGKSFSDLFVKIRFWDAPFEAIEKIVPRKGIIWDLGCGDGMLTNYLAIKSSKRNLVGIELNPIRIKEADKGLKNTKFIFGDVLSKKVIKPDVILMTHLLHHLLSLDEQKSLIEKCSKKINKGGMLIVTEVTNKPFFKYLICMLADYILVPIMFEKKLFSKRIIYRSIPEWKNLFIKNGFAVKMECVHKGMPFSHVVFQCRKII